MVHKLLLKNLLNFYPFSKPVDYHINITPLESESKVASSGRVQDSGDRGPGFDTYYLHVIFLST